MVRISASFLALAATAMAAVVNVRSTDGISVPHELHARSVPGMYFAKRQTIAEKYKAAEERFTATLSDEQRALDDAAEKAQADKQSALSAEQRAMLDEVERLGAAGNDVEAQKKFGEFEASLTKEQLANGEAAEKASADFMNSLSDEQKKALDEVEDLELQAAEGGN